MKTFICTLALLTATSFAGTPTTQPSKGCACKEKMAKMEQNIDQIMKDVAAIKMNMSQAHMKHHPQDMNKMDMKPGDMNKMGMDKMDMKPGEQKPVVMPQPQVNQATAMPQSQTNQATIMPQPQQTTPPAEKK